MKPILNFIQKFKFFRYLPVILFFIGYFIYFMKGSAPLFWVFAGTILIGGVIEGAGAVLDGGNRLAHPALQPVQRLMNLADFILSLPIPRG